MKCKGKRVCAGIVPGWVTSREVLCRTALINPTIGTPLASSVKLSLSDCPIFDAEWMNMEKVRYSSTVYNLMYAMIFTRPNFAYAVGVVSR